MQVTPLTVADQGGPLVQGVFHSLTGESTLHHATHVSVQPGLERFQSRHAQCLADLIAFDNAHILDLTFDGIELVDMTECHIRFGQLGLFAFIRRFGCFGRFGRFDELAAGVIPAADACQGNCELAQLRL